MREGKEERKIKRTENEGKDKERRKGTCPSNIQISFPRP